MVVMVVAVKLVECIVLVLVCGGNGGGIEAGGIYGAVI